MTSHRLSLAVLILAFSMLWLPLGQHDFLAAHWMKVGTFMAPFLLLVALTFRSAGDLRAEPRFLALLLLLAYIIHQFEEHWVDLYSRIYAFHPYLNTFLADLTGAEAGTQFMSMAAVLVINTSLVWLVGALAIWRGGDHVFAPLCMTAIAVVNAGSHIGAGFANGGYNPGLLTSLVLFLPLGISVYLWLLQSGLASLRLVGLSILWAILAHVIMIGGILILSWNPQVPELLYFVILIGWSILPAVLFGTARPAK